MGDTPQNETNGELGQTVEPRPPSQKAGSAKSKAPQENGEAREQPSGLNDTMENVHIPSEGSPTNDDTGSTRPSSKASRIPKISSRAAFTRTPIHRLGDGEEEEEGLPTADDTGVLITELQASDDDEADKTTEEKTEEEEKQEPAGEEEVPPSFHEDEVEEGGDVEDGQVTPAVTEEQIPVEQITVEVKVTEEDYDTDLEIEEEEEQDIITTYYKTVCDQLGLVPVEYFLRRIRNNNIRMRYRGLGPDATRAIALSLKDRITLERLDLCGNWIGAEGARFMSRLLEENDYLTDVTISENKIGSEGGLHIARMIGLNGGLRRLDISGNEFDDKCVEALSTSIENNKYLRELNLSHNKFTEYGAEFLGPAISANENLEVLDLSWNHLREKGGIAVAKGLKENVRLKVCNLSWNGLDVRGGLAIADAMQANQSLLELDISGNRLPLEVANKMAKVLTTNDTIKVLRMGNNLITSAGAISLASAINNTYNCEMEELDLTDVPVEYEFLRTMEDIKSNRKGFKVMYGPVMRAGNTMDDLSKPAIDVEKIKREPVVILQEHIVVNDMRLLDILKRYDEDNSLSISAEDFLTAVEELAVPYDKKRLQESVNKFAATATGKIYFGSFVPDEYSVKKKEEGEGNT